MRSLTWYLDVARDAAPPRTDTALSRRLGLEEAAVSQYRRGRAFPSETVMLRLAELADVPAVEALCELGIWKAERTQQGAVRQVYKMLLSRVLATVLLALALVSAVPGQRANASTSQVTELYIMRQRRRWAARLAPIAGLPAAILPAHAQDGLSKCTPVRVVRETPEAVTVAIVIGYVTARVVTVPRVAVFYVATFSHLCQRGPYTLLMLPERVP